MKNRMITAALTAVFLFLPIGTITAYAGGGPSEPATVEQIPVEVPATEHPEKPFTPGGTATVIDNATDEDGKEFYTIMTPNENVFYLVIDKQRGQENVYFLNAVTEADLLALAEMPQTPAAPVPVTPEPTPTEQEQTPEVPAPEKGGGMGTIFLIVAVVIIGGGAGWYFKIYRPKQQQANAGDDFDDTDETDPYGEDGEDTPPWDTEDEDDSVGDGEE